jgi:spermidine synthase
MLNICFGMGSTYRSSLILGLHTTAVELDPTVPSVMSWFYPDARRYVHSPLGHIVISDGRNYVRLSDKRYDLITIDAPPPTWSAGAVVLMTQEFYQEARQRLAPGGLLTSFVGWGPDTKTLIRTFRTAFRYMMVIRGLNGFGMYMMGSQSPISLPTRQILTAFGSPAASADLRGAPDYKPQPTSAWPQIIHQQIWLRNNQVSGYTGPGPLLTDNHPLSEYFLLAELGKGGNNSRFENAAVKTAEVVLGLLGLLVIAIIIGSVAQSAFARRRQRLAPGN